MGTVESAEGRIHDDRTLTDRTMIQSADEREGDNLFSTSRPSGDLPASGVADSQPELVIDPEPDLGLSPLSDS